MSHASFVIAIVLVLLVLVPFAMAGERPGGWRCRDVTIQSRWAKDVSPTSAWPEYPRPQLVRDAWLSLNGLWNYAITPADTPAPKVYDGEILVPYPVESALSGVQRALEPTQRLWYARRFTRPGEWTGGRVLLHFGAVDWETEVWLNGTQIGTHRGGYDPFTFDVTDALRDTGPQDLLVAVKDPTDTGTQPRGKQVLKPEGIFYTATSGIWQTVWLEHVPDVYVRALTITPDFDGGAVVVRADIAAERTLRDAPRVRVQVRDGERVVGAGEGTPRNVIRIPIPDAHAWSPSDPHLYDLAITVTAEGGFTDHVTSYFGMRKIAVAPDASGTPRLMLNNKFLFEFGFLDQGFWPAGLYTAPTDAALRYDIEQTRKLGFNLIRKHVKVEPPRWYMWCDRLGVLVWQDMPSGDRFIRPSDPDIERTAESAAQYRAELQGMIDHLRNHPSIVMWVPFNEGWGQFDTVGITQWIHDFDPTRLVNAASGWTDRGVSDVNDVHVYPGPGMPSVEERRAAVLGEFGGLGWPIEGHLWWDKKNWGYRTFHSQTELEEAYSAVVRRLPALIAEGLCAAVYTQTTDVEGEVNGLMTYDRAVAKLDAETLAALHKTAYELPPVVHEVVPTSLRTPQTWHYTTTQPAEGWIQADFADAAWSKGDGMFGHAGTPGVRVGTEWTTPDIWLRRTFTLEAAPAGDVRLRVYHDEDAEIYINGVLAATLKGWITAHAYVEMTPEARAALRGGENTLAVHCHQTAGGQGIDVGLSALAPR